MKIKVTEAQIGVVQGHLYEVGTEDGVAHVFDTEIAAYLGKDVWVLSGFTVRGFKVNAEGYAFPNRNYRNEAQAMVNRILARGVIDTAHWVKLASRPSLQEREAYNYSRELEEHLGW